MVVVCGKVLWSVISGTAVLPSDEVVGEELQNAAEHLKLGLTLFSKWSDADYEDWSKKCDLKEKLKEFVRKLGKLLDLSAKQSWEFFQLYLQYEFKGSCNQLLDIGANEREETQMLHEVWKFYLQDPIHLLSCRRHIIAASANLEHPYQSLFHDFLREVLDSNGNLGETLVSQLKFSSLKEKLSLPTTLNRGLQLPANAAFSYISYRLAACKHLLATLLIYYAIPERRISFSLFQTLLRLSQGSGICHNEGEDYFMEDRRSLIALQESVNFLHCLLLILAISVDENSKSHPLLDTSSVEKLDPIIHSLGSQQWHLPPLMAWGILQLQNHNSNEGSSQNPKYKKLIFRSIKSDVFAYLKKGLELTVVQSDQLLLNVASSVVYSLVCATGATLDVERVKCLDALSSVACLCLSQDPPSLLFWTEEDGGANILLPSAIELFPRHSTSLFALCLSLAKANQDSCYKIIELLKDLPYFAWDFQDGLIQVSGNQCLSLGALACIPNVEIPAYTSGTLLFPNASASVQSHIVSWKYNCNGWQVILGCMHTLELQINSGYQADDWLINFCSSALELLKDILVTLPDQLGLFIHIQEQALVLMQKAALLSKPNYLLVSSLLCFLAQVSVNVQEIIGALDKCVLLPSLPQEEKGCTPSKSELTRLYKAGRVRTLVCGHELSAGKYTIFCSLCKLVTSAFKHHHINGIVRGSLIFVIREVIPDVLRWNFSSSLEQMHVLESSLELLHSVVDNYSVDAGMSKLVISELMNGQKAGGMLRSIIERGALLESSLDQPSQWPHSTEAYRHTRTAQLALSLLNRLVSTHNDFDSTTKKNNLQLLLTGDNLEPSTNLGIATVPATHLALSISRYVHHRLNPRLPYLALRTLTSLSQDLGVPLVACLGSEAEGIKDALLMRLESSSEDIRVKIALLNLLTSATVHQPGFVRIFLTPVSELLDSVFGLMEICKKNLAGSCVSLLEATIEFIMALWEGNYRTAISYLRTKEYFWEVLLYFFCSVSPNDISHKAVAFVARVVAQEYFVVQENITTSLQSAMKNICSEDDSPLLKWSKAFLIEDVLEALQSELEKETLADENLLLLSEIYLALLTFTDKKTISQTHCVENCTSLVNAIQTRVLQVSPEAQLLIISACLRAVTVASYSLENEVDFACLLSPLCNLIQQYSILAGPGNKSHSSGSLLALATAILHVCISSRALTQNELELIQLDVVPGLIQAASFHIQSGNPEVIRHVLNILSKLASFPGHCLSCNEMASTLGLLLSSVNVGEEHLSIFIHGVVASLSREGITGIDGAVSIAAVHLQSLLVALAAPHKQPLLSFAAASLIAALAPYSNVWIAIHLVSHSELIGAVVKCIHTTTHLLRLKGALEREVSTKQKYCAVSTTSVFSDKGDNTLSDSTITLMNHLIEVLCMCLKAVRLLGPDCVDLLCKPNVDISAWVPLIQPSFRQFSAEHPDAQTNLATLTFILDLYDSHVPKEGKCHTPGKSPATPSSDGSKVTLNIKILTQCAEEALLLLLTQAALVLLNPLVAVREAREIRTLLADEMNTFFTHWFGRKQAISPMPKAGWTQIVHPDYQFLRLAQHLVASFCQTKSS